MMVRLSQPPELTPQHSGSIQLQVSASQWLTGFFRPAKALVRKRRTENETRQRMPEHLILLQSVSLSSRYHAGRKLLSIRLSRTKNGRPQKKSALAKSPEFVSQLSRH